MNRSSHAEAFAAGPALLFCPADRPDRYRKALEAADGVILDLEDAVGAANRAAARRFLCEDPLDADRVIVRVNPAGSADFPADVRAAREAGYRFVMLAKASSPADVAAVDALEPGLAVIALCESARGVSEASAIAAADNVVALMWGAEDLVASLGGTSSRRTDGRYRGVADYARAAVLIAAGAASIAAIDTVHLDIADTPGLADEAADAAQSGFSATACIHPSQVAAIRSAYRPGEHEIEDARELLNTARSQPGVFRLGDRMVDAPVLRHAEAILRRAQS